MPVTQLEIGRRLRAAREAAFLTQEQVAARLGLSRSAVAQIELGNRSVSSIEIDHLAFLYGRDIRDFFSEDFASEDSLLALFRANQDMAALPETGDALRHCVTVGRELTNLERLVGVPDEFPSGVRYSVVEPKSRYDAIKQGAGLAEQERRRLSLGDTPIEDIAEVLERQGIRTGVIDLPEDVSGLTFVDRKVGPCTVVNRSEHISRRTFSFAHEYAHVLVDCDSHGIISRASERDGLREIRANAFAANLLLPEAGVRQFLAELGKAGESRIFAETPIDEDQAIALEARGTSARQEIRLHHVALLAHHFGTSRVMALYRLRNLHIISERELKRLLEQEHSGRGREIAQLLELPEPDHIGERNRFQHRFLTLALEAFAQEQITRSKLEELFAIVLRRPKSQISLSEYGALLEDEPTGVSIPRK
jgi:Zn-dependent peptidase ImmA (M78 family)/transcriptional regulator with XRE-family HTH domain